MILPPWLQELKDAGRLWWEYRYPSLDFAKLDRLIRIAELTAEIERLKGPETQKVMNDANTAAEENAGFDAVNNLIDHYQGELRAALHGDGGPCSEP